MPKSPLAGATVARWGRGGGVASNNWPLFMTDGFFDGQTDRLFGKTDFKDGRIFGRTVSQKVLSGLSNRL